MRHTVIALPLIALACASQPAPVAPSQPAVDQAHCRQLREAQRTWGFVQYSAGPLSGLSGVSAGTQFPSDDKQARLWLGLSSAAFAAMAAGATWLRGDLIEQYQEECAR